MHRPIYRIIHILYFRPLFCTKVYRKLSASGSGAPAPYPTVPLRLTLHALAVVRPSAKSYRSAPGVYSVKNSSANNDNFTDE